jgi:hypothetical protein
VTKRTKDLTTFEEAFLGAHVTIVFKDKQTEMLQNEEGEVAEITTNLTLSAILIDHDENYYYLGANFNVGITHAINKSEALFLTLDDVEDRPEMTQQEMPNKKDVH